MSNLSNPCRPIAYAVYDCTGYLHQRPITCAARAALPISSWNYSFPAGINSFPLGRHRHQHQAKDAVSNAIQSVLIIHAFTVFELVY